MGGGLDLRDEADRALHEDRREDAFPRRRGARSARYDVVGAVSDWIRRRMLASLSGRHESPRRLFPKSGDADHLAGLDGSALEELCPISRDPAFRAGNERLRVLYAESNFVRAQFFAELLRIEGVLPDIALNGPDAVARAEETPYALVLLEMSLADGSASAAARAIREIEARTRRPRSMIICFSSGTPPDGAPVLDDSDIDAYTAGPLRLDHVLPAIGRTGA